MGVVMNYYTDLQIFVVFSPCVPFAESLQVDGSLKMLSDGRQRCCTRTWMRPPAQNGKVLFWF